MGEYWESLSGLKKAKLIVTIILSIFVITFAIVNWKEIEVEFIFFRLKMYVTLLIIICLSLGYMISSLFEYKYYNVKQKEVLALQAEIVQLKKKYPEIESDLVVEKEN
jgi:uncharacterized integral membrane protein